MQPKEVRFYGIIDIISRLNAHSHVVIYCVDKELLESQSTK